MIYITGIAGLIGSNLARAFLSDGYEVAGCDNLIGGYEDNVPAAARFDKIDLCKSLPPLPKLIEGAHTVIHTAALPYEGLSVFSPKLVADSIYSASMAVVSACASSGVKRLINCSSMARYGDQEPPFTEDMPTKGVDPYGMAKIHAEQAMNLVGDIHGVKVNHVVPHNVIGVGQRYTDPYRNVAAIMLNRCLRNKEIIVYGDGMQQRSFSAVSDCVRAIRNLAEGEFPHGEVFNIGPDGNEMSILDLATLVSEVCGREPKLEFFPPRPCEVKNAWVSIDKARNTLGYAPSTEVRLFLTELKDWMLCRGVGEFQYSLNEFIEIRNDNVPKTWTEKLM
jgi:UDP-glucose 4-epimerase